jgi:hypothetical protein
MRLIRLFGLAALAAGILMAFVGVTSASAVTELEKVVVCGVATDPCPANSDLLTGLILHGELKAGTEAKLETAIGTVKCNESKVLGETTELLAHGKITAASFNTNGGACKLGLTNCPVEVKNLPYLVLVLLADDHVKYHAVVGGGTLGEPKANVNCGGALNCNYHAALILFEVLLETHDTVWDVHQELEREGGVGLFCPAGSTWNAEYLTRCLDGSANFIDCFPKMES